MYSCRENRHRVKKKEGLGDTMDYANPEKQLLVIPEATMQYRQFPWPIDLFQWLRWNWHCP